MMRWAITIRNIYNYLVPELYEYSNLCDMIVTLFNRIQGFW